MPIDFPGPFSEAARTGQPVWVETQDEYLHRYPDIADAVKNQTRSHATACLPLRLHGRVMGAIGLSFAEPRRFEQADRDFLLALAHQTQGDIPAALALLERALMLAQPEGYVRLFVDEGAPMATLLEKAAKRGIAPNYTQQLRKVLDNAEDKLPIDPGLLDPLSERELEVLRLLGSDLTGPEIARELMVSLNTLRTHTKNIFTKLGVSNRIAAVHRADELHLL